MWRDSAVPPITLRSAWMPRVSRTRRLLAAHHCSIAGAARRSAKRSRRLAPRARSRRAPSARCQRFRATSARSTGRSRCCGSSSWRGSGPGGCARSTSGALGLYLAATVPLAYLTTVLPSFYWFFVARMRRPVHIVPAPGRRVAMITLCVPSHESLDVIAAQLRGADARALPARQLGPGRGRRPGCGGAGGRVRRPLLHAQGPAGDGTSPVRRSRPRRRPETSTPGSTTSRWRASTTTSSSSSTSTTIRPRSTSTARSATSTIPRWRGCRRRASAATSSSWTARGLAEQDLVLQGPLQMGFYGHSRTPFIIGSHTTYRTEAVRGHRRLPADARGGPPGHGRARRRRSHRRVRARDHRRPARVPRTSGPTSASSSRGRTRWCRSSCSTRRAWCAGTRPGRRSSS